MDSASSNVIFLTFGAGSKGWRDASTRISNEARRFELFHNIFNLNEKWLKEQDLEVYEMIFSFIRRGLPKGYGYYLWKTSILKWAHHNFPNYHLLYVDAGSHLDFRFKKDGIRNILFDNIELGLAWELPDHKEIQWTKSELFMRLGTDISIQTSNQIQSGFIFLPAMRRRLEFIDTFRDLAIEQNGFYFSDELKTKQNYNFKDHRHNQSVFSLLWKNFDFGYKPDETYPENFGKFPIIAMRNNTKYSAESSDLKLRFAQKINSLQDKFRIF